MEETCGVFFSMFPCGMTFKTTYHFRLAAAGRSIGDFWASKQLQAKRFDGFCLVLLGVCCSFFSFLLMEAFPCEANRKSLYNSIIFLFIFS